MCDVLPEKFTMSNEPCQKCADEGVYCENCYKESDAVITKLAAKKRREADEVHWAVFVASVELIGARRQGLIEIDMLTESQTKKAIALLEAAGFAAARRLAKVESTRYAVIEYVAK